MILSLLAQVAAAETVPEPDTYRNDDYRSPVPATLDGALVVSDDTAQALWATGRVLFVDVFPKAPKPENLVEGTIFIERPYDSIPGSYWLPNVGYGALADVTHAYFRGSLTEVTEGDTDTPIVFFCRMECWMSWNAAKRALEYGYTRVYWYPNGVDGWADTLLLPLEQAQPFGNPQ